MSNQNGCTCFTCVDAVALTVTSTLSLSTNLCLESAGRSLNTQHISYCNKFGRLIHMAQDQSEKSRGALIVLEGLDRSGKTSQSSRLVSNLESKGFPAELWGFPDRKTCVGEMISSYLSNKSQLDDQTVHLLFSANRWEKRFVTFILPFLEFQF